MSDSISKDLFDLLISKDFEVKTFDSGGKSVLDVEDASIFRFDFTVGKNNYGTAVILIDDESNFELFFGDNIGKSMRGKDKNYWYDFLYILKQFSIRHLKKFKPSNMNKMKYNMQGIAAIKEGLFEGKWTGTSKTSYNPQSKKVRIIAKHNKRLGEDDARFRNIKSLFVENGDGERFKLPFVNVGGARAMARHVSEGGNPYDQFGVHISETVKDIATMGGFLRIRSLNEQEGEINQIREKCKEHYNGLRSKMRSLSSKRGYKKYAESWKPLQIEENEAITDALRKVFIKDPVNEKIENALPLISRLQQMAEGDVMPGQLTTEHTRENKDMKQIDEFNDWAHKVTEGEVIQGPWTNKRVVNPPASNVEKLMPMWNSNTQEVVTADSEMSGEVEDFEHFEVVYFDKDPNVSVRIVGVTADNQRVAIGNISREKAEMYVNRFNHHLKNKNITEGTWVIPKTNTQLEQLRQVLSKPIPASDAGTIIYHIIGDDDLFDELDALNEIDPTMDVRPTIIEWIKENNGKFKGMVDLSTVIDEPTNELSNALKQIGLGEDISNTPFPTEQLAEKFKEPIPVGVNALNVQEMLDELVDEEELMAQLADVAESDPEADARPIIVDWLYENGYDYVADRLGYEQDQEVAGGDQVDDLINDVESDGSDEEGMQEGFDNDPSLGDWITSPWDSFNKKADNDNERWDADMKRLRGIAGDSYEAHRAEQGCLGDPRDCLTDFNKKRATKSKSLGEDAEINDMLRLAGLNKTTQVNHSSEINPKAVAAKDYHSGQ